MSARLQQRTQESAQVETLVVYNIPWFYKLESILEAWPADGSYDYLNILYDFDACHNVGYGFINFLRRADAMDFAERWHGRHLPGREGSIPLQVARAFFQGLPCHLARFSHEDLRQMEAADVLPIVFLDGKRVHPLEASLRLGLIRAEDVVSEDGAFTGASCSAAAAAVGVGPEPPCLPMPRLAGAR